MKITDILDDKLVLADLNSKTKKNVLEELVSHLAQYADKVDKEELLKVLDLFLLRQVKKGALEERCAHFGRVEACIEEAVLNNVFAKLCSGIGLHDRGPGAVGPDLDVDGDSLQGHLKRLAGQAQHVVGSEQNVVLFQNLARAFNLLTRYGLAKHFLSEKIVAALDTQRH